MTYCHVCQHDTYPGVITCAENIVVEYMDGTKLPPVRFEGPGACYDCSVSEGGAHHPGCHNERCPRCGGWRFNCACPAKRRAGL